MHYIIYKITNKINNKIYIGKHQTKDINDGYMGSGKHLKRAIKKYGIENFTKEIIHVFDNEHDMNVREAILVTENFCNKKDTYNICPGGKGGFGYLNNHQNSKEWKIKAGKVGAIQKSYVNAHLKIKELYPNGPAYGKIHSEEIRKKISINTKLAGNKLKYWSGYVWINNGIETKRIKGDIPEGWIKGRL